MTSQESEVGQTGEFASANISCFFPFFFGGGDGSGVGFGNGVDLIKLYKWKTPSLFLFLSLVGWLTRWYQFGYNRWEPLIFGSDLTGLGPDRDQIQLQFAMKWAH